MFSMGISARIVKRIITLLIVTLGVVTLSFCLQIFTGTDPAEMLVRKTTLFATEEQIQAMRVELGLDGTLSEQYADYIKGLLTGDLGISITNRKPVIDNIRNALPVTCMLVIMSMLWVAILTVLISAFSVIWKDKAFDHATRVICIIGICVPSFWLALILLIAFAVEIPIFSVISDGSIKSLILPSSLLENIRAGRPSATREEVLKAAHLAQCDDILKKLPNGIDTIIGSQGIYLSGGETQRISIARAILKDAPIVVLDEATAYADPENEHQIQKAFDGLIKNKTVIMVAHRLSTVQDADQILVMKNGAIAESGTHSDLIKHQGEYAKMWDNYNKTVQWHIES